MQLITQKKPKQQTTQYVDQNPVEAIRNLGGGAVKSFANDVVKEGAKDFWQQLLGNQTKEKKYQDAGDLQEGQDLDLAQLKKEKRQGVEPGIDYRREILHGSERIAKKESQVVSQQIEMILIELKRLASSSKELEIQFSGVVVEQRIERVGKYHQSFFEWMLVMIQTARMRIEDAGAWLAAMHGKKNKKKSQNYWNMFKKHGTTFGLSNERVVSTQTG
ncbi:MAG: hypothetical protein HYV39_00775 [Candidatus Levybacteria bacterium]|nr:hypothetical protein [Candidatus Levybacteria bacterium]